MNAGFLTLGDMAALAPLLLTGCNAVAGFGKDMQSAGVALTRSAERMIGELSPPRQAEKPQDFSGSTEPPSRRTQVERARISDDARGRVPLPAAHVVGGMEAGKA